jgi:hypothetical protein
MIYYLKVILMNIQNDKFIILEIIPTNIKSKNGKIIQLSALKIDGLKLLDRFDYRLKDESLPIIEMKSWINYDNDYFKYVDSEEDILSNFKLFSENLPILILDNIYTKDFFNDFNNNFNYITEYLELEYNEHIIEEIMDKYNLEPSNHIVDLLYEALMMKY